MKRLLITFFAAFLLVSALGAQEHLIPRRVTISVSAGDVPDILPAILYSRLTLVNPLVVAAPEEASHNTILLELDGALAVELTEGGVTVDRREYPASLVNDPIAASEAFDALARDWQDRLGLVEPVVSEEQVVRKESLEAEISFEERLITPYQATLWLPVSARQIIITDGDSGPSRWLWQWPLRLDFAWYLRENFGLTTSFRFEFGDHLSFGVDADRNPLSTSNLMLMPGVGIQVRTTGRISAEIGASILFGAVRVTAQEDLVTPSLLDGESTWVFYPVLSLEPSIVWSPTAKWSVKFRILEYTMNFAGLSGSDGGSYGVAENTIMFNFLQLGAAYRW